jgi:hypothetical protein
MRTIGVIAVAALLMAAGCEKNLSSEPSSVGTMMAKPSAGSLQGTWRMHVDTGETDNKGIASMVGGLFNSFIGHTMDIEFPSDGRFILTTMAMTTEGSVKRDGDKLTLTPETFGGMTKEEAEKQGGHMDINGGQPFELRVDEATKRLVLTGKDGKDVTFERFSPSVGAETVKANEKSMIGEWAFDGYGGEPQKREKMEEHILSRTSIYFQPDNTFQMRLGIMMDGTWSREGDDVKLNILGANAYTIKVQPDGSLLLPTDNKAMIKLRRRS